MCSIHKENSILLAAMHVYFTKEGYADTMPIRAVSTYCRWLVSFPGLKEGSEGKGPGLCMCLIIHDQNTYSQGVGETMTTWWHCPTCDVSSLYITWSPIVYDEQDEGETTTTTAPPCTNNTIPQHNYQKQTQIQSVTTLKHPFFHRRIQSQITYRVASTSRSTIYSW